MSASGQVDVAVVGGGPAGMAAAVAAARAGLAVVLVDEYAAPGGQIWRRPFAELGEAVPRSAPRAARRLFGELVAAGVRVAAGTSVWAVPEPGTLLTRTADGASGRIEARALVLATGAYDRPLAFPGWTLPGVMTAGAAQALAKGQGVVPGRRVLLAGAGPFLLPVATQLAASGAQVVAVVEATRRGEWLRAAPRMVRYPGRLGAYAGYRARMLAARTHVVWGHVIVRADGDDRVRMATIAAARPDWSPVEGTERRFAVDAVCTAYGFVPATELARALGCELRGEAVAHDDSMRTTVPGVFVAGEAAGIGGADLARVEGELAGRCAAAHARSAGGDGCAGTALGRHAARDGRALTTLRRRRAHAAGFVRVLDDLFGARPGILSLADAATPLCRCEDVTAAAVDAAVAAGADTLAALKIATRCGQGPCQGRVCERLIAARLPAGAEPEGFRVRAPLRPIELPALIDEAADPTSSRS